MVLRQTEAPALRYECGSAELRDQFLFDPHYHNLNHGSFGGTTRSIRDVQRHNQDLAESRPDPYIRYDYPKLLDENREAIAAYVHAPVDTCVFVPNATTGVNTVLRNLVYKQGDVIIYFATIYGSCEKTVAYITETTAASAIRIPYTYPVTDDYLCNALECTIADILARGRNPKIAIFDTIASLPGVRMPFEELTQACRQHGVLSLIDGAHGVGHIPLNLSELDPDFFISNCHKWLYVPRSCALLYVPKRNQKLMRSTLPTSHWFLPLPAEEGAQVARINNPLPPSAKSKFVQNFEYVGTLDDSPYTCVKAAVDFRRQVSWKDLQGEDAIMAYCHAQAVEAGTMLAETFGTEVMENKTETLGQCNFTNVRLPLNFDDVAGKDQAKGVDIAIWISKTMVTEYDTFIAVIFYGNAWWVRLSAQIYLDLDDWRWAGGVLQEACAKVKSLSW